MKKVIKLIRFIKREHRLPTYQEILSHLKVKRKIMPLPVFIQLEPTTRCNLNCVMCTRSKMNPSRLNQDLSLEKFKYILKEIPTVKKIKLQGMGEPLLTKDLWKITQYGISKKKKFTTIINGTLINKENVDLLLKNFVEVTVSLDTPNPENYLQIRRMNFFERVVENLKLLTQRKKELKSNTKIFINSVISHLNYKEIDALIELAKNCGVDGTGFVEVENWKTPLERDYEEERKFVQQARKFREEIQQKILLKQKTESIEISFLSSEKRKIKCRWPFDSCFITVDGFVTPCCIRNDPEVFNLGNIFETPFKEIWNGKKYQEFRETMIKNLPNPICDNCPD